VTVTAKDSAGCQVSSSSSGRHRGWGWCRAQLGEEPESGAAMAEERLTAAPGSRVEGRGDGDG
jgi:hypothetical protein